MAGPQNISPEVSYALRKAQGGMPLSDQDKKVLQDALLQLAPASPEYKAISSVVVAPGGSPLQTPTAGSRDTGGWRPSLSRTGGGVGSSPSVPHGGPVGRGPDAHIQPYGIEIPGITPPTGVPSAGVQAGVEAGGSNRGTANLPDWGPHGAISVANPTLLQGLDDPGGDWDTDPVSQLEPVMGGMNAYGLEHLVGDPQFAAEYFSRQLDPENGSYMSQYYEEPMKTALALAQAGVLGTGGGTTLNAVRGQDAVAKDAMAFMQQMYGGDQAMFPDTMAIENEVFQRALNTDWGNKTNEQGQDITVDDIIDTTNNAMFQISPFLTKDSSDWLASMLNGAAKQYKLDYAQGKTEVSYPEYLRQMGIIDAISGNS